VADVVDCFSVEPDNAGQYVCGVVDVIDKARGIRAARRVDASAADSPAAIGGVDKKSNILLFPSVLGQFDKSAYADIEGSCQTKNVAFPNCPKLP
jgi:hypothetical protein